MRKFINTLALAAPSIVAFSLIAGNVGLLCKHGVHPNLETAVGFLWIASDYALPQKRRAMDSLIMAGRPGSWSRNSRPRNRRVPITLK